MISKETSDSLCGELQETMAVLLGKTSGMKLSRAQTLKLASLLNRASMALNTAHEAGRRGMEDSRALAQAQLDAAILSDLKDAAIAWRDANPGKSRRNAKRDLVEQIKIEKAREKP